MVHEPPFLLCDEVTSGLDPKSESEIVHLLHNLGRDGRTVISVTHSLRHLELHDTVTVLYEGRLVDQGRPGTQAIIFRSIIRSCFFPPTQHALGRRMARALAGAHPGLAEADLSGGRRFRASRFWRRRTRAAQFHPPSFASQFLILLRRRWILFRRNRGSSPSRSRSSLGSPVSS